MSSVDKINVNVIISIAYTNEAIVRNKRNHINNKTGGKCHAFVTLSFSKTKVSFVFHSTIHYNFTPL